MRRAVPVAPHPCIIEITKIASTKRTLKSVWINYYKALSLHFKTCSEDSNKSSLDRNTFRGLFQKLTSTQFLSNFDVMYDAAFELSILSESLQHQNMTLVTADRKMRASVRCLEDMIENAGKFTKEADEGCNALTFRTVMLHDHRKYPRIVRSQFFRSLAVNLEKTIILNAFLA